VLIAIPQFLSPLRGERKSEGEEKDATIASQP